MLTTLEHLEMVEQVGQRGRYRVGPGLEVLAGRGTSPQVLKQLGRPHLENLVSLFGEDAALAVPEGKKMLYISQAVADRTVHVEDWTGHTFPLHTVATGQVCLAEWREDQLRSYLLQDLVRLTSQTVVDPKKMLARLDSVRLDGFAWAQEESAVDISGVAAPVRGPHGKVVAALGAHGPSYRFPGNRDKSVIGQKVRETADRLTLDLAGFPSAPVANPELQTG
jgi:DNA-binding IclR family transcriptional regulator